MDLSAPPEGARCGECVSLSQWSPEDAAGYCTERRAQQMATAVQPLIGERLTWPARVTGDPACPLYRPHGGRHD